jgi:hypothetical protein
VTVEVGEGFGVVGDHGVEVEGLRVGEVGVGDGDGDGGPVGAEPAAEAVGVIACAEVVVAGFGIAFLAFEFVVLPASVSVGVLAAVGIEARWCYRISLSEDIAAYAVPVKLAAGL